MAAETEREKGKTHQLAGNPSYRSENATGSRPPGDAAAPDGNPAWQALCLKPRACLPGRFWIERLAVCVPRLIGLKEKKCYFSSHKTTKRNG